MTINTLTENQNQLLKRSVGSNGFSAGEIFVAYLFCFAVFCMLSFTVYEIRYGAPHRKEKEKMKTEIVFKATDETGSTTNLIKAEEIV